METLTYGPEITIKNLKTIRDDLYNLAGLFTIGEEKLEDTLEFLNNVIAHMEKSASCEEKTKE